MTYVGPRDPELFAQWRHERRMTALEHHPDRGGAAETLTTRLAGLDTDFAARDWSARRPVQPKASSVVQTFARWGGRRTRSAKRRARVVRGRIPSGWPGARRYIDL